MIRIATEADIPAMLAVYAPYVENTTYTFEYTVPTVEEFLQRFRAITAQMPWLVWEENGTVLGYAYGSLPFERAAYAWCAEISIYLALQIRGRGIGRQMYGVLEQIMALQGYRVIYSLITSENQASLDFHKAVGYRFTAEFADCGLKFGRWLGVIWLEKRLDSVGIPSEPPRSWRSFGEINKKLDHILAKMPVS